MTGPKEKPGDRTQLERFKETARAIGADEDEAAFKAKLAVVARQKIAPGEPDRPSKKKLTRDKVGAGRSSNTTDRSRE